MLFAAILKKVKTNYEKFHSVDLSDEVLEGIVALSDQYVKQRSFPDKALDLLDEACSWKKVSHNKQIVVLKRKIEEAGKKKDETVSQEDVL